MLYFLGLFFEGAETGFRQELRHVGGMPSVSCKTTQTITVNNPNYAPNYAKAA